MKYEDSIHYYLFYQQKGGSLLFQIFLKNNRGKSMSQMWALEMLNNLGRADVTF